MNTLFHKTFIIVVVLMYIDLNMDVQDSRVQNIDGTRINEITLWVWTAFVRFNCFVCSLDWLLDEEYKVIKNNMMELSFLFYRWEFLSPNIIHSISLNPETIETTLIIVIIMWFIWIGICCKCLRVNVIIGTSVSVADQFLRSLNWCIHFHWRQIIINA